MAHSECAKTDLDWVVKQGDFMASERLLTCMMANAGVLWV